MYHITYNFHIISHYSFPITLDYLTLVQLQSNVIIIIIFMGCSETNGSMDMDDVEIAEGT